VTPWRRLSRLPVGQVLGQVLHGIRRLPEVEGDKPNRRKLRLTRSATSKSTSPRSVRTEEGRLYLFVAIDRTSKAGSRTTGAKEPFSSQEVK
jgi:hypothetical protein